MRTTERMYDAEYAFARVLEALSGLGVGWSLDVVPLGPAGAVDAHVVLERDGIPVKTGVGHGKGFGVQALCSAVFESIEHMTFGGHLTMKSDGAPPPGRMRGDAVLGLAGPGSRSTDVRFESLDDGDDASALPAEFCGSARTGEFSEDQARLIATYYSSNGWAAGLGTTEATLHAVNELVERDAFSSILVDSLSGPAVFDPVYLGGDLASLRAEMETRLNRRVRVFRLPSVAATVCLAVSQRGDGEVPNVGCGASVGLAYSAERALLELWQDVLADQYSNPENHQRSRRIAALRRDHPALFVAASLRGKIADGETRGRRLVQSDRVASPSDQLATIVRDLKVAGYASYRRIAWESSAAGDAVRVVQVVVPGLKRFHLVHQGFAVEPIARLRNRAAVRAARGVA